MRQIVPALTHYFLDSSESNVKIVIPVGKKYSAVWFAY